MNLFKKLAYKLHIQEFVVAVLNGGPAAGQEYLDRDPSYGGIRASEIPPAHRPKIRGLVEQVLPGIAQGQYTWTQIRDVFLALPAAGSGGPSSSALIAASSQLGPLAMAGGVLLLVLLLVRR